MKIISKYWQDIKNLIEEISIKFGGFLPYQDEFGTNCAVHQNIGKNIGGNLYIGQ